MNWINGRTKIKNRVNPINIFDINTVNIKKLKVLPVPRWAQNLKDFSKCGDVQIDPIIGRNGYFYDRIGNWAWIEYNGVAYTYDESRFKYDLMMLSVKPLSNADKRHIIGMIDAGLGNIKEFKFLLSRDRHRVEMRNIHRRGLKYLAEFRKIMVDS